MHVKKKRVQMKGLEMHCHRHINSLQPGHGGHFAVWPHAVDEGEVSHIEGTIRGRGEARGGEERHLVGVPLTPVAAQHLPLFTCAQEGGHQATLPSKVDVLSVTLLQNACLGGEGGGG